ncbi:hypothetical protein Tco_1419004 [Tanacetum coccineum]
MWIAIERLQQRESINIQDVKTKLFWEFGKFTSKDEESIESYYTRFYRMMNEMVKNKLKVNNMQVNVQFLQQLQPEWSRFVTTIKQANNLDNVSYHTLFDILKLHQNEVNEIHAERTNPLLLIVIQPTPQSESASEEDSDEEHAQRDKQIQKSLALIAKHFKNIYKPTNNNLRTSSSTRNKNVDISPRTRNDKNTRQFVNQRTIAVTGSKETIGNQEVLHAIDDTSWPTYDEPLEKINSNIIPVSSNMCDNERKDEQNAEELKDERVLLASLIVNLKLDVDENKKIQKQLKKANMSLTQELDKYKLDLKYCKIEVQRNQTFQTNQKDKEAAELKCKEALDLLACNT